MLYMYVLFLHLMRCNKQPYLTAFDITVTGANQSWESPPGLTTQHFVEQSPELRSWFNTQELNLS